MAPTFDLIGLVADDQPHVEVALPGGLRLAWDTVETIHGFAPEWSPASGGPAMSLAFRCDSAAEVDRVFADVVGAGYDGVHQPWDAPWGQRYATVADSDGNHVDLFASNA